MKLIRGSKDTVFTLKMQEIRAPMVWERGSRAYNINLPWQNIGKVIWKDGLMTLSDPLI